MPGVRPADLDELEIALLDRFAAMGRGERPNDATEVDGIADDVFDAQLRSRHTDRGARWLRSNGTGYYTIGSAGHEANAWVAAALRPTDPALLHYRSGAFYLARAAQAGHDHGVRDIMLGVVASVDEPIAGGRHKVFGHRDLAIIPQTSTIASHLPRALGVAFAIGRAAKLEMATAWPPDAVAICSFGDASANHSTAQGTLNAAAYTASQNIRLPLLFVCEDNGWGISVPSPPGWVAASLSSRSALGAAYVDGTDAAEVYTTAAELAADVRRRGRPAVLHLRTVRFGGHAGSDAEAAYRTPASIRTDHDHDPLLATARLLRARGLADGHDLIDRYLRTRAEVLEQAERLAGSPTLSSADQVVAPLTARSPDRVASAVGRLAVAADRAGPSGHTGCSDDPRLTLAEVINHTLADLLTTDPGVLVFGEDVGVKGGVYGVTRGLQRTAGAARVFDTLLDEQSILGLALGTAVSGFLPIAEIQYLAYVHNAADQLRGEAATLPFFSSGQYRNGMVVRIAAYGYQRGFGGHFHNDNAVAALRDIPGLVIASPGHPRDAAAMLRTCAAAARVDGTVSIVLEPIARYHTRDLHEPGDAGWTAPHDPPAAWSDAHVSIGEACIARDGDDVLVVTWANGLYLSLRVADRLAAARGISCRVLDVRWLAPLPIAAIRDHAADVGTVVVVDETRQSGGVGEGIVAGLVAAGFGGTVRRVAARDSFIPLGDAAELVLVSEDDIEAAVLAAHTHPT